MNEKLFGGKIFENNTIAAFHILSNKDIKLQTSKMYYW
ncbi:DUF5839 family protein [Bacillus sp. MUM 116]